MASFPLATTLSFLLFCILIKNGSSITCYNCSSWISDYEKCYETSKLTKDQSVECGTAPCLKIKPIIIGGGSEVIERGCYKQELCTKYSVCYVCDDMDYCNSSLRVTPSYFIFVAGLITLYYCLMKVRSY